MNLNLWIAGVDLAALSGVSYRAVAKGIEARFWRGHELAVKEEFTGRGLGRGGKTLLVHVDTLPPDLREQWYAQHGIRLHEKRDAITGEIVLVPDGKARAVDAQHQKSLSVARWRLEMIRPALAHPARSSERGAAVATIAATPVVTPNGKTKAITPKTIYNWLADYERAGLHGLVRKGNGKQGVKVRTVTGAWDKFFIPLTSEDQRRAVADDLNLYIRSIWAAGARGWRAVSEQAGTRLIELTRDLGGDALAAFEALPVGRPSDTTRARSQFGLCYVHRGMAEAQRKYALMAVQRRDNAAFQDRIAPSMRRDYSELMPRQIVVGDVHPVDVMMRRLDDTVVYPKAISWFDPATNEIHMTFVLLEPGEGIRREHVAQSFEAMVDAWGLPSLLYLDNGSEYSDPAMMAGFTELSRLSNGRLTVFDLDGDPKVSARVAEAREAIVRSRPYNAKGKPGIEGAFGNLEQVFFSTLPGWTAGDRMSKKTHAKGKDPIAFPGTVEDFLAVTSRALEWYHARPQHGRLAGRSPNEVLADFIDNGWGKTALKSRNVLALAFAETVERMPDRGRVSYTPRRGKALYFYDDALLGVMHKVTLRVPAFNPEFVFVFDGDRLLCQAFEEQTYGVLDPAGAVEVHRRGKALRRKISDMRANVAHLELTEETKRHLGHMPAAPEAPVSTVVDAGMLDRLADLASRERDEVEAEKAARLQRRAVKQWKVEPDPAVQNFQFAEE